MSQPTDWSECPQLRPALGDIVEVASILPIADANPRPAKDPDPRELATLRLSGATPRQLIRMVGVEAVLLAWLLLIVVSRLRV